eukprot:Gb_33387 [translate_table: standard]
MTNQSILLPSLTGWHQLLFEERKMANAYIPTDLVCVLCKWIQEIRKQLKESCPVEEAAAVEVKPGFNSRSTKSKETLDMIESYPNVVLDGRNCKKRKLCESPFKDLARTILKFGEVYEKIETLKQWQIMVWRSN